MRSRRALGNRQPLILGGNGGAFEERPGLGNGILQARGWLFPELAQAPLAVLQSLAKPFEDSDLPGLWTTIAFRPQKIQRSSQFGVFGTRPDKRGETSKKVGCAGTDREVFVAGQNFQECGRRAIAGAEQRRLRPGVRVIMPG